MCLLGLNNLLVNPGAEDGSLGWQLNSFYYGSPSNNLQPRSGKYTFRDSSGGSMFQIIDISSYANIINTGLAMFKAGGWSADNNGTTAMCLLEVTLLDLQGKTLYTKQTNYFNCSFTEDIWRQTDELNDTIPTGAVYAKVYYETDSSYGNFDDLNFQISDNSNVASCDPVVVTVNQTNFFINIPCIAFNGNKYDLTIGPPFNVVSRKIIP